MTLSTRATVGPRFGAVAVAGFLETCRMKIKDPRFGQPTLEHGAAIRYDYLLAGAGHNSLIVPRPRQTRATALVRRVAAVIGGRLQDRGESAAGIQRGIGSRAQQRHRRPHPSRQRNLASKLVWRRAHAHGRGLALSIPSGRRIHDGISHGPDAHGRHDCTVSKRMPRLSCGWLSSGTA